MLAAASLLSLLLGTTLACAAERLPSQVKILESSGGAFLIVGLSLIGSGLPFTH